MDQIMSIPYSNIFSICPKNWEIAPLQEHLFFQEGPGILAKDFRDSGVSLLRLAGVGDKFATLDGCNFLDPEMVDKKWPHFRLDAGDIVTSASASFGRTSIVGKATEGAISYTGIIRFRPRTNKIVPGFIELFLRSPFFENQARSFAVGGVIQHFGPTHLKQMAIALPPIEEQMAISSIIGAFDDKIELNRRMHATLKATAQALFKSWFVDFDPVRAKMEGRAPEGMDEATAALFPDGVEEAGAAEGMDEATAALFPDGLEESESDLGRVPRGWKVQSLDEIAEFLNGLALQKFPATDPAGSLPVIKIAELRNGISAKSDRAS